MVKRFALAILCMSSVAPGAVWAHGQPFNRANIATNRTPGLRFEVPTLGRQTSAQPTTSFSTTRGTRKTDAAPAPAATPEWNPLRRRRMATQGPLPGADPDFSF
jgi:hypothetical protein